LADHEQPAPEPGAQDREARKADLEALFREWEERREPAAPDVDFDDDQGDEAPPRANPLVWRTVFATAVLLVTGSLLHSTRTEFGYFLADEAPLDLGSLKDRYAKGERTLEAPSNVYVTLDGLFVTHEMEVIGEDDQALTPDEIQAREAAGERHRYFLCPMFAVVVRTTQPFPTKPWGRTAVTVDAAYVDLLNERKAFPQDLTVSMGGQGRLIRASEAPSWARSAVNTYRKTANLDPEAAWVFIDGDAPGDYASFAILWAAALLAPVLPLVLLGRALLARRRRRRT
jgi:hypothetical protein